MLDYRWALGSFAVGFLLCWVMMWGHLRLLRSEVNHWREMWRNADVRLGKLINRLVGEHGATDQGDPQDQDREG